MNIVTLFLVFLKIGLLAIGGAYSFLPLMEREIVENYQWLTREEFVEVLAMVKIFPGAISIKFATYTGYKVAGVLGIIIANLGNFLGPALLVVLGTTIYSRFRNQVRVEGAFSMIQVAVFAMLIVTAFKLINVNQLYNFRSMAVLLSALLIFALTSIHPAFIIGGAGIIGAFLIS